MNVKMSVFVILVEAICYENKKTRRLKEIWHFQTVYYLIEREYIRHGHFVGFCRRVDLLWSEHCQNSVNQLNNANETY